MPDDLEDRVIRHLAQEAGIAQERIRPEIRLQTDLGMDGDDAVEYFRSFGAEFGVELDVLYEDWDRYFAPEGGGGPGLIAGALSLLAVFAVITAVGRVLVLPDWPLLGAGLALWFLLWFLWPFARKLEPITVEDLVRAAEAGEWCPPSP